MTQSTLLTIGCAALALTFSAGCDEIANGVDSGRTKVSSQPRKDKAGVQAVNGVDDADVGYRPVTVFTIATYNVNWGNRDADATAEVIREANADLVCIQESRPELEEVLKRELRSEYPHTMFRGDGERFPAERFGFLSKHRVRKERFLPARDGIFGSWIIEVEIERAHGGSITAAQNSGVPQGSVIQVANVHLEPVRPPPEGKALTIVQVFADTENIHAKEIAWIYEHLSPSLPTIVAGDFNSLSSGAAPAFLRAKGFVDSFAAVTESADTHATWRWPTRWIDLAGRIDYIFHSPDFLTIESRILKRTTSDHSLVVSKLELRGAETK